MAEALKLESAALITFYAQLEEKVRKEAIYEHEVPPILDSVRRQIAREKFLDINSFPMILGSGPNGAIVHYRAEEGLSSKLDPYIPILCDTGAQYTTGTTDTTRTLLFNEPSNPDSNTSAFYNYLKEMYTRVLMGNLDL